MTAPPELGVKARKILGRFPAFMRAGGEEERLFHQVVESLAQPLDELDVALQQVLESHWAERAGSADLERIGALVSLERRPDEPTEAYRRRLMRCVRAFLHHGPTPRGVIEVVAATLGLELDEGPDGETVLLTSASPDPRAPSDPYTFRAVVVKGEAMGQYLDLAENPWETRYFQESQARAGLRWTIAHGGLKAGLPTMLISGGEVPTAGVKVTNLAKRMGAGFRGQLQPGDLLILRPDGTAWLNGRDVSDRAYWFAGPLLDTSTFDDPLSRFGEDYQQEAPAGFGGFDQGSLTVAEGRFDNAAFDGCVYEPLNVPGAFFDGSRFDQDRFWGPVIAGLELYWEERKRAAFAVYLPPALAADDERAMASLDLARRAVERIRAAGVQATVTFAGWMLGLSALPPAHSTPDPNVPSTVLPAWSR